MSVLTEKEVVYILTGIKLLLVVFCCEKQKLPTNKIKSKEAYFFIVRIITL
jgi:hypothetical protein